MMAAVTCWGATFTLRIPRSSWCKGEICRTTSAGTGNAATGAFREAVRRRGKVTEWRNACYRSSFRVFNIWRMNDASTAAGSLFTLQRICKTSGCYSVEVWTRVTTFGAKTLTGNVLLSCIWAHTMTQLSALWSVDSTVKVWFSLRWINPLRFRRNISFLN